MAHQSLPRKQSYTSDEADLVASLIRAVTDAGVRVDPSAVINLYVALKSKPLAILAGPANGGKAAAVQSIARVLTGGDTTRFRMLAGHAWWAGQSGDVGLFTEAQTRLNTMEIIDLMAEAWQPENASRVLIACLVGMSQAEIASLFSAVAFQLRHGQIIQLSGIHLPRPIPYPPNLLLIGTMDVDRFESDNTDLLEMATVIHWSGARKAAPRADPPVYATGEGIYLLSRVRSERGACQKLSRILEQEPGSMQPLFQVESVLRQHHYILPSWVRGAVLTYLANAWDQGERGLFDRHAVRQRTTALDLALAQIVLPHVTNAADGDPELYPRLKSVFGKSFPYAATMVDGMSRR